MRSLFLLAATGLIGVLILAVPVSSQNGFFQPLATDPYGYAGPAPASEQSAVTEPTVERLPPVEMIAPGEMPRPGEQDNYLATLPSSNTLPPNNTMPPIMPAPSPRTVDFQPPSLQPAQTIPAQQASATAPQPVQQPAGDNRPPLTDAILDTEIIDPIVVGEETCDAKKKKAAKIWSGNVELGLNGTEGNSQTFNFHIGFNTKRKTECSIFTADLDYNKKNSDSVNTANRLLTESRLERPHCSTPWTWYVHCLVDYDEFQPWDVQVNADTGIGYQIIASDSTDLTGRFGGGFSREVGGPNDEYVPELVFGVEFEHRIGDRHKLKASAEYFPDVTDFAEFRMVDKASWEVLLDKEMNLSLSLNAIETINRPNPGGKEADLDYSAVLLWKF